MPDEKAPDKAKTSGVTTASANPRSSTSDDVADTKKTDADLLGAAAASSDAAVHQLLGEREIAARNGDEDALKDIDARLRQAVDR